HMPQAPAAPQSSSPTFYEARGEAPRMRKPGEVLYQPQQPAAQQPTPATLGQGAVLGSFRLGEGAPATPTPTPASSSGGGMAGGAGPQESAPKSRISGLGDFKPVQAKPATPQLLTRESLGIKPADAKQDAPAAPNRGRSAGRRTLPGIGSGG